MTVLACGPFTGDWEQEIFNFRPCAYWVYNTLNPDSVFLSTHFNRSFLYDWVNKDNIFPIYETLSRNELSQKGFTHDSLQAKDHTLLTKIFKEKITSRGINKKDITLIAISQSKNGNQYPFYNKQFVPILTPNIKIRKKYKILYIPDIKEDVTRVTAIYNTLRKRYNGQQAVVGDFKTHLSDKNIILREVDYFENGYKYIIKYLSEADVVICPAGHWTVLCNQQKIPVFSWGDNINQYKEDGLYHLGNRKCLSVYAEKTAPPEYISDMMMSYIEKILT